MNCVSEAASKAKVALQALQTMEDTLKSAQEAAQLSFGLMWTGFCVFWERMALKEGPLFMQLWGIPFLLIGFHLLIGRFFVDAFRRSHTYYALTSQRAVIMSGYWNQEVRSIWLKNLQEVSLKEGSERGSIELGAAPFRDRGTEYQPPTFEMIEHSRHVYGLLQTARSAAGGVGA